METSSVVDTIINNLHPQPQQVTREQFQQMQQLRRLVTIREKLKKDMGTTPQDHDWAKAADLPSTQELHKCLQQGKHAQEQIIRIYQRRIQRLAYGFYLYCHNGKNKTMETALDLEDLQQEAVLAAMKAVEKFDLQKAGNEYSKIFPVFVRKYIEFSILKAWKYWTKLDQKIKNQKNWLALDPERLKQRSIWLILEMDLALEKLSPLEQELIRLLYGFYGLDDGQPMTKKEVAQKLKIEPERLAKLKKEALKFLKKILSA